MDEQQIAKLWERAAVAEQREDWTRARRLYLKVADAVPRHAATFQRLGLIALRQGRPEDAVDWFQRSLAIEPADPVCLNNLGNVLRDLNRLQESLAAYRRALDHQPNYTTALYNLGGILVLLGDHQMAADVYRALLRLEPGDAEIWNLLGLSLLETGQEDESKNALREALRLKPNDAEILNELGVAHQHAGELEEARRLYLASIETDPGFTRAYDNFVRSRRMKSDDIALVESIEKIAGDESRDDESRLIAHFALGKFYDDCEEYDKAFESYAAGNALKHRLVEFDAAAHAARVDRLVDEFNEGFFRKHAGAGNPSMRPVFVVGMIRSGTSLTEQILASHSRVYGAGELLDMANLVTNLPATLNTRDDYPECVRELDAGAIENASGEYLRSLASRNELALRVVDKRPMNFLHLGLIAAILPNARIVHCRREALDVCLSIYFQRFAHGHNYAYEFDDIAAYYAEYERLMEHWMKVLPVEIHDVHYERLLDDFEVECRRMVNYCELDWEVACLEFHRSTRSVRTASSWQVRQPLYRSAMARWKNFEPHLDGLKRALSERGVRWGLAD